MKLPSSRPGDDASLLRRTSQVRVLRRQPVIKSDGWTSGEVLGPSSRRDGFDSRTVYQHAGLAHVCSGPGFHPGAAGIRTLPQLCPRGVQQQHVGLQNRRSRCESVRGCQSMLRKRRQRRASLVATRA